MASVQPIIEDTDSFRQREYSAPAKRALARKPALFINNEWVASTHGATLIVEDPSTGREVGRIVDASDADVDRAVAAARAAFDDGRWSNLPPKVRERTIKVAQNVAESEKGKKQAEADQRDDFLGVVLDRIAQARELDQRASLRRGDEPARGRSTSRSGGRTVSATSGLHVTRAAGSGRPTTSR